MNSSEQGLLYSLSGTWYSGFLNHNWCFYPCQQKKKWVISVFYCWCFQLYFHMIRWKAGELELPWFPSPADFLPLPALQCTDPTYLLAQWKLVHPSQQNGWQPLNQCFHISYLVNNFHQQFFASLTVLQKLHGGCHTPDLLQNSNTQPCLVGAAVRWRGCSVVQLQNLCLLLAMPEPEMSQLFFNIPTEVLSYLI